MTELVVTLMEGILLTMEINSFFSENFHIDPLKGCLLSSLPLTINLHSLICKMWGKELDRMGAFKDIPPCNKTLLPFTGLAIKSNHLS